MDVSDLRREYLRGRLEIDDLKPDPMQQFERWFKDARDAGVPEPNAMGLASCGADSQPSLRTVLMKYFDEQGLVFFTNLESAKAEQMRDNPRVALLFYWQPLERQVIIRGLSEQVSNAEALKYFTKRPRGSQLGAWVSDQSRIISSRQVIEMKLDEIKRKFSEGRVPIPSFWGGYRIRPGEIEFWQGRESRLHDRFLYRLDGDDWNIVRLAP